MPDAMNQYVQPVRNDALVMGNAPMIPTRDGSCKYSDHSLISFNEYRN